MELVTHALLAGGPLGAVEQLDGVDGDAGVEALRVVSHVEDDLEGVVVPAQPDVHLGPHPVFHILQGEAVQLGGETEVDVTQHRVDLEVVDGGL